MYLDESFALSLNDVVPEGVFSNMESDIPDCEYKKMVIISDRCKGLKVALNEEFPENLSTSCAFHLKGNVASKFPGGASKYVLPIAKTFSSRQENELFAKMEQCNPGSSVYLKREPAECFRNTEWVQSRRSLPRRFGIVTSNASESTNAWILEDIIRLSSRSVLE